MHRSETLEDDEGYDINWRVIGVDNDSGDEECGDQFVILNEIRDVYQLELILTTLYIVIIHHWIS